VEVKQNLSSNLMLMSDVLLPEYEKLCLHEYVFGDEKLFVYNNSQNAAKI